MFEKFTSAGGGDFRQRYLGTFGFYRDGAQRVLSKLTEINIEHTSPHVVFTNKDGDKFVLRADSKRDDRGFEFLPPKNVWSNTAEGIPLLVQRVPARQYQRGICDRNTRIEDFSGNTQEINFEVLDKLYATPIGVAEAFAAFKKNVRNDVNVGLAVSSQFAVSEAHNSIKCFNIRIGRCRFDPKEEVFKISLDDPSMWLTEVTDAFHRAGIGAEIK